MDDRAAGIATDVVCELSDHEKYVRVQTRNPTRALRDLDAFRDVGEYVTIGTSIPAFDEATMRALESRAPSPESRIEALETFSDAGVQVYVMASPTYPTMDEDDLRNLLERVGAIDPAVVFYEPFNARSARLPATIAAAESVGNPSVADAFRVLSDDRAWIEYAVRRARWVQEIGAELSLPIHVCPLWQFTRTVWGVRDLFTAWRERQPPEQFAGHPLPDDPPPAPPTDPFVRRYRRWQSFRDGSRRRPVGVRMLTHQGPPRRRRSGRN